MKSWRKLWKPPKRANEGVLIMKDTIIAELRKIRDEHAARFNYDLDAIVADLRRKEKSASAKIVSKRPRRIVKR